MVQAGMTPTNDAGIAEFLAERARNATETRLTIDIAVGSVAFVVAVGLRPDWWQPLGSAGLCLFIFGCWAATLRSGNRLLRPLRVFLSGAGIAAALATAFFIWAAVMGTWIS